MRHGRASLMGAMLAVSALGMPAGPGPRRLFSGKAPKYPGQREAYLVGAWRPLSPAAIGEHNKAVDRRKAEAREAAALARLGRTIEELRGGAFETAEVRP